MSRGKTKDMIRREKRGGKKLSMLQTRRERKGKRERWRERETVGGGGRGGVCRADRVV